MQQVATFDIAFEEGISVDGKMHGIGGKLRGQVLGIWGRVQRALSAPTGRTPAPEPQALSGYYGGAYARVSAAVPVASFRGLV